MIGHPLLLAVLLLDALTLSLVLAAAATAMRVVLGWSPRSATWAQLQLERRAEAASLQTRCAIALYLFATAVLIFGIADVLPQIVPGAMCGTGVLQATRGLGYRALLLRGIVLAAMGCWHLLDRFNRRHPDAPLTAPVARTQLLLVPLLVLALITAGHAFLALDTQQPVSCCAAVYDQVRSVHTAAAAAAFPDAIRIWSFLLLSGIQLAGAAAVWRSTAPRLGLNVLQMGLSCCWVVTAYLVLVQTFAAYYYQVLYHHCPWCLLLPAHHLVGYPLFTALAITALEGSAGVLTALVDRRYPLLRELTAVRSRHAGLGMVLATTLFLLLTLWPAVLWRLRFGVWMH